MIKHGADFHITFDSISISVIDDSPQVLGKGEERGKGQ